MKGVFLALLIRAVSDLLPAVVGSILGLVIALIVALCDAATGATICVPATIMLVVTFFLSLHASRIPLPGYYGTILSIGLSWKRPIDAFGDAFVAAGTTCIAAGLLATVGGIGGFLLALLATLSISLLLGYFVSSRIIRYFPQKGLAEILAEERAAEEAGKYEKVTLVGHMTFGNTSIKPAADTAPPEEE
jgi:uncharacterized membrane protein (UPF0136 family)